MSKKAKIEKKPVKINLACGQNQMPGFVNVDIVKLTGVDIAHDLLSFPWPFMDGGVEEIQCHHFFEHVPGKMRGKFMDECHRILVPSGKMFITVPYARSTRATQDYTHEWPPISEESFLYFNKGWREQQKLDHYDVKCDFDFSYGYVLEGETASRSQEARDFFIKRYWNAILDLQVFLTKR